MTVPEVATSLGVKQSAVRKAIARGTLRATVERTRTGWKYVVSEDEVERYRVDHRTPRRERSDD